MVNVRGVNVYPSAVEAVVRRFADIAEYRATVARTGALRELLLEIEVSVEDGGASRVARNVGSALRESLGLTVPVQIAANGSLPRFEMKARRFVILND